MAFSNVRAMTEHIGDDPPVEYTVRDQACPAEYVEKLGEGSHRFVTM